MSNSIVGGRAFGRSIVLAGALLASAAIGTSPAGAGQCPTDKVKPDAREAVNTPGKGVTDTVIASIDLSKEPINAADRLQRLRKLVIEPGGIVPWHSHTDRPAIIYIIEGEIVEYASNCSVPIVHKTGEVSTETKGTSHWWKNLTDKTVVLLSFDILHDKNDHHM